MAINPASDQERPILHWPARQVTITADPPQAIQADGEMLEPGPIYEGNPSSN